MPILINVLTFVVAIAIGVGAATGNTTVDFALYYAGGHAAATTSYVDEKAVGAVLRDAGLPRTPLAPVPYGSPVLMATVFRPLAALDVHKALGVYYAMCLVLLAYTASRLSQRWVGPMLLGLVLSSPFFHALTLGNWSVVTGCLVLLTYLDVRDARTTRGIVWVSLATLWKLFPIVLFVPFIVKRMWRPLLVASCIGGIGVVLSVVVLRPHEFAEAVLYGLAVMQPTNTNALNLSIPGVVYRLTENGAAAGTLAIVLPVVMAVLLWRWRAKPLHDLIAVATVAMLLTNGLTWPHYAVSLFVFLPWLGDQPLPSWVKRVGIWLFAVVMTPWFVFVAGEPSAISAYARFPYLPGAVTMLAFMLAVLHRNGVGAPELRAAVSQR